MNELIRIEHLWKVFGGRRDADPETLLQDPLARVAVRDVSLTIGEGEIFVVMGLSGSGKSTLLRMVNGLIQPSAGEILVSGRHLRDLSASELRRLRRRSMAMVFQSFALFPHRSALENAAFGLEVAGMPKRQRQERAQQALERVGLGNDLHRRPDQLSGGMRQRVGLARALALDPPILLMDEAFSALDPLIRRDMQDLLLDLQREHRRTVVFISHDLDEAIRIGDRIALMQEGQLLQCGTAEDLLRHPSEEAVSRFFQSVDASAVLSVGALAEPAPDGMVLDLENRSLPLLNAATLVRDAMSTVAQANRPVPVVGDDHHLIGVVTPQALLRAIATP